MTPGPGIARTPLPQGFSCSGINSGVRKYRPDLGLIASDRDCVAAGVFTQSESKAAPVLYSQGILPSDHIRAIITNSGQANAATGPEGTEANWKMALTTAQSVGCLPHQVLTASTGVIGQPLQSDKILPAIPELMERLTDYAEPFAVSILTTDLVPKSVSHEIKLSGGTARITGICKGSGMIHPNMATMLGYLLTDVELELDSAKPMLQRVADLTFNMISVDGDTSTNDSLYLLANGASGVRVATAEDQQIFEKALYEVAKILAQSIARDGEGATKLIEVNLIGSPSDELARNGARGLTISPLIKTAIHGEDPNWGRIFARLGAEKMPKECLDRMTLEIQGEVIFAGGKPAAFDREKVRGLLKADTVTIGIDFKSGTFGATAWGCDLSRRYVEINTDYS